MTESGSASFGDAAGEMANETEVEAPTRGRLGLGRPPASHGRRARRRHQWRRRLGRGGWTARAAGPGRRLGPGRGRRRSRPPRRGSRSAPPTCSGCRPSSPTTASRVDRDRAADLRERDLPVLAPIIEVLDTIDRAREHGEVEGGFKAVADQLERTVSNLGPDPVRPARRRVRPEPARGAQPHGHRPGGRRRHCRHIAKAGYKIGDRVVRAAQVLVVDPVEALTRA